MYIWTLVHSPSPSPPSAAKEAPKEVVIRDMYLARKVYLFPSRYIVPPQLRLLVGQVDGLRKKLIGWLNIFLLALNLG
jgi:hypothetical protein